MRKRVVRAVIFLAIAVAAAVGGATAAGAMGAHAQYVQTTDDGIGWE
jgi:hypothetical protein